MLTVKSLYPHLSEDVINSNKEFCENYKFDYQTDDDVMYLQTINEEADMLTPVLSSGWRMSDIDSINSTSNPLVRDMLLSRMQRTGSADNLNEGLSDDEIADNVVSKYTSLSDIDSAHSVYNTLREEMENAPIDETSVVEPSTDVPPVTE